MFQELSDIPIIKTIDALGLTYKRVSWDEYHFIEQGEMTSWWTFNTQENIVKDFNKDRWSGWNINFVMSYLRIDKNEAINWFREKWLLESKKENAFMPKWFDLKACNETQVEYIKSRGIEYDKVSYLVRDYNWSICCALSNGAWICGIMCRRLTDDHNNRFHAMTWTDWKWFYWGIENPEDKRVIIVEGMFDCITLKQFFGNVIWLKSCNEWLPQVRETIKWYELYLVPHNDEAWQKMLKSFDWYDYNIFNLGELNVKDVNDMANMCWWDDIALPIFDFSEKKYEIWMLYDQLIAKLKAERENGWMIWIEWPIKEIYGLTRWVIKGKCYYITAYSNTGKSKFMYFHAAYFIKQGYRVWFITLEEDEDECLREIIKSYQCITDYQILSSEDEIDMRNYRKLTIKQIFDYEWICSHIENNNYDVVFIDYAQLIVTKWWSDYEKNKNIALWLQILAQKTETRMFIAAQISESTNKDLNWNSNNKQFSVKGAWEYFFSAVAMFGLQSSPDWGIRLYIQKNKKGKKHIRMNLWVDFERNQFKYLWIEEDF